MNSKLVSLSQALLACPSITPDDAGCQDIIRIYLSHLGFHCESLPFGAVSNLWARLGNTSPLLVFAGHTDVVPPGDGWVSPPFQPEIRDGYLYGRGATDMKAALAAQLCAVELFLSKQKHFPGSIAFLITSDEEGPAELGTVKVLETLKNRHEKIDYCIIGEASSEKTVGDQLRIGRRGSLHGKLTVYGKQSHVAYPHLANNPIHRTMLCLHQLSNMEFDQGNEFFPATSLQITNIHSGTGAKNVIPKELIAHFNIRFGSASSVSSIQQKIIHLLEQHHMNYAIDWTIGGLPFLTQQGKLLDTMITSIKKETGLTPMLSTGGGTSDGRFIAPTGAEVIELGVIHETAHQVNECVKLDELNTLMNIYLDILMQLFKQ